MIHAYHVIWGTYGFWLPNDPRGSWSDFVASWELSRFGKATGPVPTAKKVDRKQWIGWRTQAVAALKHAPVRLAGAQAREVARGFANAALKSKLLVWACSILPEHVHLVIARHRYPVERACNLLKGEATKQLRRESLHPDAASGVGRQPLWQTGQWKVFLETDEAIAAAIRYVEQNPIKEGKRPQCWSFVRAFRGIEFP